MSEPIGNSEELLPCPFCGSFPVTTKEPGKIPKLTCQTCNISLSPLRWNHRQIVPKEPFLGETQIFIWKTIRSAVHALTRGEITPGHIIQTCPVCGGDSFTVIHFDQQMAMSGGAGIDAMHTIVCATCGEVEKATIKKRFFRPVEDFFSHGRLVQPEAYIEDERFWSRVAWAMKMDLEDAQIVKSFRDFVFGGK